MENQELMNTVLVHFEEGDEESAIDVIEGEGSPIEIVNTYIGLQISLNEAGPDVDSGWSGTQFVDELITVSHCGAAFSRKAESAQGEAIILHNLLAFLAPEFDENIAERHAGIGLKAAVDALELRKGLGEPLPLAQAYWDLGLYRLITGDRDGAIESFTKTVDIGEAEDSPIDVAWAKVFRAKTQLKLEGDRNLGIADLEDSKKIFEMEDDEWGIGEIEKITTRYAK